MVVSDTPGRQPGEVPIIAALQQPKGRAVSVGSTADGTVMDADTPALKLLKRLITLICRHIVPGLLLPLAAGLLVSLNTSPAQTLCLGLYMCHICSIHTVL